MWHTQQHRYRRKVIFMRQLLGLLVLLCGFPGCVEEIDEASDGSNVNQADMRISIIDAEVDLGPDDAESVGIEDAEQPALEDAEIAFDAMPEIDAEQIEDAQVTFDAASPCFAREFHCGDGECIPETWVCNGMDDCMNRADEETCLDASLPDMMIEDAAMEDANIEDAGNNPPGENARVMAGQSLNSVLLGNANGGQRFNDVCPAGQVLIGFAGAIRAQANYLGQLAALCGEVGFRPEGPTIQREMALATRGRLGGGGNFVLSCPDGHAVTGYGGRGGALVDEFFVFCSELELDGERVVPGNQIALPPAGGGGGRAVPNVFCADETIAIGGIIRAGDGIDAAGISCAPIEVVQ